MSSFLCVCVCVCVLCVKTPQSHVCPKDIPYLIPETSVPIASQRSLWEKSGWRVGGAEGLEGSKGKTDLQIIN